MNPLLRFGNAASMKWTLGSLPGGCTGDSGRVVKMRIVATWIAAAAVIYPCLDLSAATIEQVRDAWRRTKETTQSVQYVCETQTSGPDVDLLRQEISELPRNADANWPGPDRVEFKFILSGEQVSCERTRFAFDPHRKAFVPKVHRSVFNGTQTRTLMSDARPALAKIVESTTPASEIGNYVQLVPIWLAHDPLRQLQMKEFLTDTLAVTDSMAEYDGIPCVALSINSPSRRSDVTVFIDPAHDFRVVCFQHRVEDRLRKEVVLMYDDIDQEPFLLTGWRSISLSPAGTVDSQIEGKVVDAQANFPVDPSTFTLSFPKGARVRVLPAGNRPQGGRVFFQP